MNLFKVNLTKWKGLSKTRAIVISMMAVTVFLCGSCDLIGIIEPDQFETNNSISDAYPLEQGDIYIAHIAENDADFFSFSTTHGSTTFDEVEISVNEVGADLKIGVAIYNSKGELIGQDGVNTPGANLTYTLRDLQSDETYYVRFSGTWGDGWTVDGIGDNDSEGSYSFRVMNLNANDEFAGNHSINDAHTITTGQSYDGVLVSKYEADYFAFTPTSENMQLQISNVGSDLTIGVALYLPNFELAGQGNASTAGANYGLNLTSMNTEATYYLRFSGTWGDGWTVDGIGDNYSYGPYSIILVDNPN
jgi:hypothetical protein